jgi:hypothetical protein
MSGREARGCRNRKGKNNPPIAYQCDEATPMPPAPHITPPPPGARKTHCGHARTSITAGLVASAASAPPPPPPPPVGSVPLPPPLLSAGGGAAIDRAAQWVRGSLPPPPLAAPSLFPDPCVGWDGKAFGFLVGRHMLDIEGEGARHPSPSAAGIMLAAAIRSINRSIDPDMTPQPPRSIETWPRDAARESCLQHAPTD